LLAADFDGACAALMRRVETQYAPDLLVGIRTGGLVVAEAMARAAVRPVTVLPLTCRRASTGTKARLGLLRTAATRLPRPMLDHLRVLEHRLLTGRRKASVALQPFDHHEAATISAHIAAVSGSRVLVVDDAVDSGVTLATVLGLLRQTSAATEIRSAVITVTLDDPRVEPDFALYRGVLCRFPWSFDAGR
jgi:hypoxanthine phosphoribosyltransferase